MPIIRRKLDPNTVYPEGLRYNSDTDTVQSNVNGTWVNNPEADPRTQTTFPPRITSDPACDAAQSVTDAIHGQIDGVIDAIDNASTLFTIAGIILSIFTFGAYAIFIGLALGIGDQMLGFGTAAITAALTEPVYDTFKCILFCHFTAGGRLEEGGLGAIIAEVNDQIGGIGATILNAMLSLAGEGGINNLASLGTSTGDCSGCDDCGCRSYEDETLHLNTAVNGSIFTSFTTRIGANYRVTLSGLYQWNTVDEPDLHADAFYVEYPANTWAHQLSEMLFFGSAFAPYPAYNGATHTYQFIIGGNGTSWEFSLSDPDKSDNAGTIDIHVECIE